MAGFYSFVVFCPGELPLERYGILLERGPNTFNVLLRENLEDFLGHLTANGVRVVKHYRLDEFEPVPVPPLPNEAQCEFPNEFSGGNGLLTEKGLKPT